VSVLDQLEEVTEEERAALLSGDWRTLQTCVERKQSLADRVPVLDLTAIDHAQARRLRTATSYNLELASSLSRHLHDLVTLQRQEPTYNHRGRLARPAQAVMSLRG
jgi:flagellar biosynthesis/type III secretory pathway chaperone